MLVARTRRRMFHQTKANLTSSPTTFSFSIPESRIELKEVRVTASLSDSAFKNYGVYAKKGDGNTRIVGGGKLVPLTVNSPSGTGGGGAGSGGGGGGATFAAVLENENVDVIVNHGGASGAAETITVTIEYEVLL